MTIQFKIKRFNELSATELYNVLQLRSEVFIVEQNCVYQDIDGKDEKALHVLGYYDGTIAAYCRLFAPGDYFEQSSIGRVVIGTAFRDRKWGHILMRTAIHGVEDHFKQHGIVISAQLYLKRFYESHGFAQTGEEYLEDGIPHIRMVRNL
jgi:ElaA protein